MSTALKQERIKDSLDQTAGFMHFFKREMEQIFVLELKTNEMIRKLADGALYAPLKKAIQNYMIESRQHINWLRTLGIRSNQISLENKEMPALMIRPLYRDIDAIGKDTKLKEITLITGIQKILFYQMAFYRSLCTAATKVYNFEWAEAFNAILKEKRRNDTILSAIALSSVYRAAINE